MLDFLFDVLDLTNNGHILYIILGPLFEILEDIFGFFIVYFGSKFLMYFIFYVLLPYFLIIFINQRENKMTNKEHILFIDAFCFFSLFFLIFLDLTIIAEGFIPLLDRGYFHDRWLFSVKIIAGINSFLYACIMDFKLLKKYIKKWNRKVVLIILIILFILTGCYFFIMPYYY